MKLVKWASAIGTLAVLLIAVGCGSAGSVAETKQKGNLNVGVSVQRSALIAQGDSDGEACPSTTNSDQRCDPYVSCVNEQCIPPQFVCIRYKVYTRSAGSTSWPTAPTVNTDWICGGFGKDKVTGTVPCLANHEFFVDYYKVQFCEAVDPSGDPTRENCNPLMESRAVAGGKDTDICTAFEDVDARAKPVQFDNVAYPLGGVDPGLDVDQVCWGFKWDACSIRGSVIFGIGLGPDKCETGNADDFCVLSHGDPDVFTMNQYFSNTTDPKGNILWTVSTKNSGWEMFFLSFDYPKLTSAGLHLYSAPWVTWAGNFNSAVPGPTAGEFDEHAKIFTYNRDQWHKTVGSWLYNYENGSLVRASVGAIIRGEPGVLNTEADNEGKTVMYWDWSPDVTCDAAPTFKSQGLALNDVVVGGTMKLANQQVVPRCRPEGVIDPPDGSEGWDFPSEYNFNVVFRCNRVDDDGYELQQFEYKMMKCDPLDGFQFTFGDTTVYVPCQCQPDALPLSNGLYWDSEMCSPTVVPLP